MKSLQVREQLYPLIVNPESKFPPQLCCGACEVRRTPDIQHEAWKLPSAAKPRRYICSYLENFVWAKNNRCGKGFASLSSTSIPDITVRVADATQMSHFLNFQGNNRMGNLQPVRKAVLQYLGNEIRHARLYFC